MRRSGSGFNSRKAGVSNPTHRAHSCERAQAGRSRRLRHEHDRATVNARAVQVSAEPRTSLADFVRDKLDLTGTHLGCEHGVCGACHRAARRPAGAVLHY